MLDEEAAKKDSDSDNFEPRTSKDKRRRTTSKTSASNLKKIKIKPVKEPKVKKPPMPRGRKSLPKNQADDSKFKKPIDFVVPQSRMDAEAQTDPTPNTQLKDLVRDLLSLILNDKKNTHEVNNIKNEFMSESEPVNATKLETKMETLAKTSHSIRNFLDSLLNEACNDMGNMVGNNVINSLTPENSNQQMETNEVPVPAAPPADDLKKPEDEYIQSLTNLLCDFYSNQSHTGLGV